MKKFLSLVLCLGLVIVMLSGCMYEKASVTIDEKGSGKIVFTVGYSAEMYDLMNSMSEGENQAESPEEQGFVKRVIDGKEYWVEEEVQEFTSLEELNESFGADSEDGFGLSFGRVGEGFTMSVSLSELTKEEAEEAEEASENDFSSMGADISEEEMAALMEDMVMEMEVTFPTYMKFDKGSADEFVSLDGKTVTIDLYKVSYVEHGTLDYFLSSTDAATEIEKPTLRFDDVSEAYWAYGYINKAVNYGLFSGTKAPVNGVGHFAPESAITRAQFITTVMRAIAPERDYTAPEGKPWYWAYYDKAQMYGVINGDDFDAMTLDKVAIPREEMAYILVNAVEYLGAGEYELVDPSKIPDWNDITEKYQPYVQEAYSLGLIAGMTTEGHFRPMNTLTRAQAATVMVRFVEM